MKLKHRVLLLGAVTGTLCYWNERRAKTRERDLAGSVVAITGGSRGLGLSIARELADEGCRLAICARDQEELNKAREDLESRGAQVLGAVCDVLTKHRSRRSSAK